MKGLTVDMDGGGLVVVVVVVVVEDVADDDGGERVGKWGNEWVGVCVYVWVRLTSTDKSLFLSGRVSPHTHMVLVL